MSTSQYIGAPCEGSELHGYDAVGEDDEDVTQQHEGNTKAAAPAA